MPQTIKRAIPISSISTAPTIRKAAEPVPLPILYGWTFLEQVILGEIRRLTKYAALYEENVSGKLSDDRFAKVSRRYEDEQKELAEKKKLLHSQIEKQSSQVITTDMFIALVRKYTRTRKLTPRMLNELIEKREVFNAETIDGV